jgi:hypothetical protein
MNEVGKFELRNFAYRKANFVKSVDEIPGLMFDHFNPEVAPGETRAIRELLRQAQDAQFQFRLDANCLCR